MKVDVMRTVLWAKFSDPRLADMLTDTGDEVLAEENEWGDRFWGTVNGVGQNHLGKLLMDVRSKLRMKAEVWP